MTRTARIAVLGDGIAGVAACALIPGAVLLPSQPPRERSVALDVPFSPGPRHLHDGSPALDLVLASGLDAAAIRDVEYPILWRVGDRDVLASELDPFTRLTYYSKSRPGVVPRAEASTGSAGADTLRVIESPGYFEVIGALRKRLEEEGRILDYVQLPLDPDPGRPVRIGSETYDLVIYTCPPNAIWPDFEVVAADKLFLPVRVESDLREIRLRGAAYRYRPGPEVPWHRETIGSVKLGKHVEDAAILEWTLPPNDMPPPGWAKPYGEPAAIADAVLRGLRPLDRPWRLRGAQVLPSPYPSPSGASWCPLGRVATRSHGALVTDVAAGALKIRREWVLPTAPERFLPDEDIRTR